MITTVIKHWLKILTKPTSIVPLAIFRMAFGFLMAFSMIRFIYKGWIEDCYITPDFHFTYQYFEWVKPFDHISMYLIVVICGLSALCIGLGFLYRIATLTFFLTFTYLELIEKSWYLNHYYFVSLVAFLLILVPAHRNLSIDAKINTKIKLSHVPAWSIIALKLQLCIVYFFGGIAKIKTDWLLEAQPLKIWLNAKTDVPFIGWMFEYDFMPYLFSWTGMIYDLIIPFLLWQRKTRPIAYVLVITFHVLTFILFNIGMFPWLMIFGSLIFITLQEWQIVLRYFNLKLNVNGSYPQTTHKIVIPFLIIFFTIQSTLPLRHLFLTNNVLWTENGIRFAWHVMVMEKNGFVVFTVIDNENGKIWKEYPSKRLTSIQEKQMSFQPDMIWQYAHYLKKVYHQQGYYNLSIYANSKVSLNGKPSRVYINPQQDLLDLNSVADIYEQVMPLK